MSKEEYIVMGLKQPANRIAFIVTQQGRYYSIVRQSQFERFATSVLEQKCGPTMKKTFPTLEEAVAFVKSGGEDSKAYRDEGMMLFHKWKELVKTTQPIVFSNCGQE